MKFNINTMDKIDLREIIQYYDLDASEVAKVLFPSVKYPKAALDRVLRNESTLDLNEIKALADYIGVLVSDLVDTNDWKGRLEDSVLVFVRGPYKAKLRYNGVFLSIFQDNTLIHQEIGDMPNMTIKDFIKHLNNTVKNLKDGHN